jgi:phosphoribosylamine-glycine ligase
VKTAADEVEEKAMDRIVQETIQSARERKEEYLGP